jgi:hypothetical protein
MAQEKDEIYVAQGKIAMIVQDSTMTPVDPIIKLQYELDYVRHCLYECHQEKGRGYALSVVGGMMMGIGMAYSSNNVDSNFDGQSGNNFDTPGAMFIVGGVMSLVGTIMVIDSEKWLKRAYLGPNGFGVKFVF